jgi:shikimate dehydrogenase
MNLKKMGLVGNGISKSRMPRYQEYLGQITGIPVSYELIDGEGIEGFDAIDEIEKRRNDGYEAVGVTHPYKQAVYEYASPPLEERFGHIGSYNLVRFVDDKPRGANTDYTGFMLGCQHRLQGEKPGSIVQAGAGGVGRAVAFGLAELGATSLQIYDTNEKQSADLVGSLKGYGYDAEAISQEQFEKAVVEADGLINCTPLGMHAYPGSAFPAQLVGSQKWIFEAVYTPLETEFLKLCRDKGLTCMSGYDLWVFQGLDVFQIVTGVKVEPTDELMAETFSWVTG